MKYYGSCLCGDIKYEIDGEFENFYLCHCKSCRKDTGSVHAANMFSTNSGLKWLKGEKEVKVFNFNGSGHIKAFCPNCGSALPNIQMNGSLLVVPAGSLDTDIPFKPTCHIYLSERANWDNDLESIPKYKELP